MVQVDYADVLLAYPTLESEATEDFVDSLIDRATRLLYSQVPRIDERIAAGILDRGLVADKIVECVLRVVRNPDARYTSEAELGYSYTINKRLASGDLWYPDTDLALLRPKGRGGVGVVRIGLPCEWVRE